MAFPSRAQLFSFSLLLLIVIFRHVSAQDARPSPCGSFPPSFILFSERVVLPHGPTPAAVLVEDGVITAIRRVPRASQTSPFLNRDGLPFVDFGRAVISPGLVDVHVHLNQPGREDWEGVVSGTKAAAAGGITTLIDMPLNSIPTVISKDTFLEKVRSVQGKTYVDVGFWGGLVPENAGDLTQLEALIQEGVLGLKSFMCPSGILDFPDTNATHFEAALPLLAKYGLPLLVHAEVPLPSPEPSQGDGDPRQYSTYEASRPPAWEREAIKRALAAFATTGPGGAHEGAHLHVVHLADATSLALIKEAKAAGTSVTVETCPHYLAFTRDDVADGDTRFKCAPPIRGAENRESLWRALQAGDIDMLSSDHSPCSPELKLLQEGDFLKAWGGISGLQLSLPVTWTMGQSANVSLLDMALWWSQRPAALANLGTKGQIAVGKDADLVVWNPEAEFQVDPQKHLFHRHKVTPYEAMRLSGEVVATFVRGQMVYREGEHSEHPCGKLLVTT